MRLVTGFAFPPIPSRDSDWFAYDGNTFDAEWDDERGCYVSRHPIGWGATEEAAIADLKEKIEESSDAHR